jgi:hypothetical protein
MMNKLKLITAVLSLSIAVVGVCSVLPSKIRTQPVSANEAMPFDHSQCQYPDRTTNPVDGCDNSDPCDPQSAAKGGSGDCVDIEQPKVNEIPKTVDIQPVKPNQCGGK